MILKPLFRRHFLVTFVVFVVMIWFCAIVARYLEHFERDRFFKSQTADLVSQIQNHAGDKAEYVKQLNLLNEKMHSPITIELKDDQVIVSLRRPPGPPPGMFGPRGMSWFGMPIVPFLAMLVAVLLASGVSLILLYRSFRDKAELAKEVLGRMQQGDLKARFPISKWDEASQIFLLYNQMADEIERLVERLMQNEKTRVALLQELAHDLRTPVSSLRNVVETIRFDEKLLDEKTKEELKTVALHETEYLSRLVEDLLFLALVLEPKYKTESEEVQIRDLVIAQLNAAAATYPKIECELIEATSISSRSLGSAHLLRRLFRNAFENACSFAKTKVTATIREVDGFLEIKIRDDGPGLPPSALETFGKKKNSTRYQSQVNDGRLSVGLGSVIMQTIAAAHSGQASIQNIIENDRVAGAELTISIRSAVRAAS